MKAAERLKAMKQLGDYFDLEKLQDILKLKENLEFITNEMMGRAYAMPRNVCTPSGGMCACSGACMSDEAKQILKDVEFLSDLTYKM